MRYLFLMAMILTTLVGAGQDTTYVKKYKAFIIRSIGALKSSYVTLEEEGTLKPIKNGNNKVIRFKNSSEVYDYMEDKGWILISASALDERGWNIYCVFRRKTVAVSDNGT